MYRHPAVLIVAIVALAFAPACDKSGSSNASGDKSASAETAEEGSHHEGEGHAHGEEGHDHEGEGHAHEGEGHEHAGAADEEKGDEDEADEKEKAEMVEVPDDGKEFDPSIKASQVPKGAWHCDMDGKVHYAAMKKGDGKCPVCNMKLTQK